MTNILRTSVRIHQMFISVSSCCNTDDLYQVLYESRTVPDDSSSMSIENLPDLTSSL